MASDIKFHQVYGVDFSGARLAGRNTWVARIVPATRRPGRPPYLLAELSRLEDLCGTAERAASLAYLVRMISESHGALWALNFPFGLPVEVMEAGARWPVQIDFLRAWGEDGYGAGLECLRRARALGGPNHIRRLTDLEERALRPLPLPHHLPDLPRHEGCARPVAQAAEDGRAAVPVPAPGCRRARHRRGVPVIDAEAAGPDYKQPEGGPLTAKRLRTRRVILGGLAEHVVIADRDRRRIMRNGGGDALDAVIAAVGAARAWRAADHRRIAGHARYSREGRLYV